MSSLQVRGGHHLPGHLHRREAALWPEAEPRTGPLHGPVLWLLEQYQQRETLPLIRTSFHLFECRQTSSLIFSMHMGDNGFASHKSLSDILGNFRNCSVHIRSVFKETIVCGKFPPFCPQKQSCNLLRKIWLCLRMGETSTKQSCYL